MLCLPSGRHLTQLASNMSVEGKFDGAPFLERMVDTFEPWQLAECVLMIDAVHLTEAFNLKHGQVTGAADNMPTQDNARFAHLHHIRQFYFHCSNVCTRPFGKRCFEGALVCVMQ